MKVLKHFTLLIVEDNKMAQTQLKQIFDGYFKAIYQAYDGDEALIMYRENNPDIVLTDITMPGRDGLSMAREIKKIKNDQPILILSARGDKASLLEAANIPVDGYIPKPITDLQDLLGALERIGEKLHRSQEAFQVLYKHSRYDYLTQMPNRFLFNTRLEEAIEGARQAHSSVALFYIDLDNLKYINDRYGHPAGDHAIQTTISNIHDVINPQDLFARIGGDEFALIVETVDDTKSLETLAERILLAASLPVYFEGTVLGLSCSIGIARYPYDASNAAQLVHASDHAMYHVKKNGKKHYAFYAKPKSNR
jgi:diguanylate cyclase (GGDEF)-like protein